MVASSPHSAKTFDVPLTGPIDIPASLDPLRRWGDDGIDRWDGSHLVRTVTLDGRGVAFCCTPSGTRESPVLRTTVEDANVADSIAEVVRHTFIQAPAEFRDLVHHDPLIARLDARYPGHRQYQQPDLLAALVRAISAQQVNLTWAAVTRRRLGEALGERHEVANHAVYRLDPERLAGASVKEIRALQFTTRKAEYIIGAANAIASGQISLARLRELPDEEIIARLTAIRGIGVWTAEWILARSLGRPRVVAGDLGVRKAVGLAYLGEPLPPESRVREVTAHWGLSATVAQSLLLEAWNGGALPA